MENIFLYIIKEEALFARWDGGQLQYVSDHQLGGTCEYWTKRLPFYSTPDVHKAYHINCGYPFLYRTELSGQFPFLTGQDGPESVLHDWQLVPPPHLGPSWGPRGFQEATGHASHAFQLHSLGIHQEGEIEIVNNISNNSPCDYILKVKEAYNKAKSMKMIKRDTRWTMVFEDFEYGGFSKNSLAEQTNFLEMRHGDNCCIIKNEQGETEV